MKTSTRLTLLLTMAVSGVMSLVGYIALQQRAAALEATALEEVRAHAVTLRIALEEDYVMGRQRDVQRLLDRLRENRGFFGVILFNENGTPIVISEKLARAEIMDSAPAREVIATGKERPIRRRINEELVQSLILPMQLDAQRRGAMEISLPVSFIESGISQERRIILSFLVALCITIFFVVALVTHFSLVRPVGELLKGVEALGRGELEHQVVIPSDNEEFNKLAQAFNNMAANLDQQQRAAARAAAEQLQLERRLRHSERLAAVGHLAAGVAHEIGAPLQVIDGRAKQLQDQPEPSPEKRLRNLTIIRTQTQRITRIVRNLLDFSRPFHPRLRPVDLRQVVNTVFEACELQAAQNQVVLEHESGDEPVFVKADPGLLQQVFTNLCVNALHAMPAGGTLSVRYKTAAVVKDGTTFALARVIDTGSGIPPANLAQIFDPYFTTKEVGHGTGLGLAVSSRIIQEHSGWIEASNWQANGKSGAQFAVYLPCCEEEAGAVTSSAPDALTVQTN